MAIQSVYHEEAKTMYRCDQCEFESKYKASLKTHFESVHQNIKYPCNLCDFQGTQKGNLKSHIQRVHERISFACEKCNYRAN